MQWQTTDLKTRQTASRDLGGILWRLRTNAADYAFSKRADFEQIQLALKKSKTKVLLQTLLCFPIIAVFVAICASLAFFLTGDLQASHTDSIGFLTFFISATMCAPILAAVHENLSDRRDRKLSKKHNVPLKILHMNNSQRIEGFEQDLDWCNELIDRSISHLPLRTKMTELFHIIYQQTLTGETGFENKITLYEQILLKASMYELLTPQEQVSLSQNIAELQQSSQPSVAQDETLLQQAS